MCTRVFASSFILFWFFVPVGAPVGVPVGGAWYIKGAENHNQLHSLAEMASSGAASSTVGPAHEVACCSLLGSST